MGFNYKEYMRVWRLANKNKIRDYNRKYHLVHESDPTHKKMHQEAHRKYYQKMKDNPDFQKKQREYRLRFNWKEYYITHREKLNKYSNDWQREYRKKNRTRVLALRKEREEPHKDKIRVSYKRWAQSEKGKMYLSARNAIKRSQMKDITTRTIQMVYEDNIKKHGTLTCIYCFTPIEFGRDSLEHKQPLSRGGTNRYDNLGVACRRCNSSKCAKTEKEFRETFPLEQSSHPATIF